MQTKTYNIPTDKLKDFIKKFDRIQRKADKIGGLVGYKLGAKSEQKLTYWVHQDGFEVPKLGLFEVQEVTVYGDAPIIEGWEVIAVVDHRTREAGSDFNLVHDLGIGDSAIRFRTVDPDCDHCKLDRRRKTTVVIRHTDTREQKQVGLGCLADFTGTNDPHRAARLCTYLVEALESGEGRWADGATPLISKVEFLSIVAALIREHGWASKGSAGYGRTATAAQALEVLHSKDRYDAESVSGRGLRTPSVESITVTDADRERAQAALEWIEFEANVEGNDFLKKLQATLDGDGIVYRHTGIAAALFVAYDKAQEHNLRKAAQEGARESSDHVGVEGERDEFVVTVTGKRTYEKRTFSYYDSAIGVLVSLADDNGNILKWFTTPGGTANKLQEGCKYRVAATVKKHDSFRDVAETVVNRVSVREALS